jgi:preprotein translocase subunit SecB
MSLINLQGYKVDRIEFVNQMDQGTKIQIGNKFSYNVQYSKERNVARAEFDLHVHDKENPEKFGIHVVLVGFFAYDTSQKKEIIHAATFKALFPYMKALITTVTANCGIQPLIIPEIDIDNQEIYRIDNA